MALICIGVRRGIFWDKVRFRASKEHTATFFTMMGDRTYYVEENEEFTLRMSKDDMWEIGDKTKQLHKLITSLNSYKFSWYWE